jgi:hypothetical protein
MTAITANPATSGPTIRARDVVAPAVRGRKLSRIEALLDAMGFVGALVDPSGVLAAQRFSRAEDEH